MTLLAYLAVVAACRGADLLTTWLVTPDLRWERNPLIRWMGWRWTLLANLAVCPLAAWAGGFFFWGLCGVSLLAALWNGRLLLKIFP